MTRSHALSIATLCAGFVWAGCGPSLPPVENGGFKLDRKYYEKHVAELRPRAAFDLGCPAGEIEFSVLSTFPKIDDLVGEMGVTGCGQRLVYVHVFQRGVGLRWVLNSASASNAAK